jgi:hypothetical protein
MILLTSTSDKLQITTSTAAVLDVHVSYIDYNGTTITPGRQNTIITGATTTDVVASPVSSVQRNIKSIVVRNTDASLTDVITLIHTDGTSAIDLTQKTLLSGYELSYFDETGFSVVDSGIPFIPNWYGKIYGAYGRCDPQQLLRMAQMAGSVPPTPTNITTSIARIAYFRPPVDITVNKVRYYGVGATANIYRIAIYNADTLARLTAETAFTTVAATWGSIFSSLNLTLTKDQLYFIAVSVNAVGTTAGVLALSPTIAATTGQIQVVPKSWPGNLDLDLGFMDGGFADFAVTTGALPATAPTIAIQSAWTGGFPLFFLDNNNA